MNYNYVSYKIHLSKKNSFIILNSKKKNAMVTLEFLKYMCKLQINTF